MNGVFSAARQPACSRWPCGSPLSATRYSWAIVRWVLYRTPRRPPATHGIAFATFLSIPFMLSGLGALYPERWVLLPVFMLAGLFSIIQLYYGLPQFMRMHQDKAYFYGACIIAAGMLAMVSVGVFYLES